MSLPTSPLTPSSATVPPHDPPSYYAPTQSTPHPQDAPRRDSTATTILPSYAAAGQYGIYGSEDEYLTALRQWAERRAYIPRGDQSLVGFYGSKSAAELAQNLPDAPWSGRSKNPSGRRSSFVPSFFRRNRRVTTAAATADATEVAVNEDGR